MTAIPKPRKRIKDAQLLRNFSVRAANCALCGANRHAGLHAHHVLLRSRGGDDVTPNLVALCHWCHGAVHNADADVRFRLGRHLIAERPDVTDYLEQKLGGTMARVEFVVSEFGLERE